MDLILELDERLRRYSARLHRQVYAGLRKAILGGRVAPRPAGALHPGPGRALRPQPGHGDPRLRAAGPARATWRRCRARAPACAGSCRTCSCGRSPPRGPPGAQAAERPALSPGGAALARMAFPLLAGDQLPFDFRHGRPALDAFPMDLWSRLLARHARAPRRAMLDYEPDPRGHGPLREAIAAHLRQARAVRCEAAQVIVTGGAQQALDLAVRVLVQPGETVAMEDPGYPGASGAFLFQGARLRSLPAGPEGVSLAPLRRAGPCRLVYVTPLPPVPHRVRDAPWPSAWSCWSGPAAAERGSWRTTMTASSATSAAPPARPAGAGSPRLRALRRDLLQVHVPGPPRGLPGGAPGPRGRAGPRPLDHRPPDPLPGAVRPLRLHPGGPPGAARPPHARALTAAVAPCSWRSCSAASAIAWPVRGESAGLHLLAHFDTPLPRRRAHPPRRRGPASASRASPAAGSAARAPASSSSASVVWMNLSSARACGGLARIMDAARGR